MSKSTRDRINGVLVEIFFWSFFFGLLLAIAAGLSALIDGRVSALLWCAAKPAITIAAITLVLGHTINRMAGR